MMILLSCTSIEKNTSQFTYKNESEYLLLKGINLKRIGEYSEAIEYYKNSLKNAKSNKGLIYKELGESYSKLEDYTKSIYYCKESLKYDVADRETIKNISYVYFLKKDYVNSLIYLEKLYEKELGIEDKKLKAYLYIKNNQKLKAKNYSKEIEKSNNYFDEVYYTNYLLFLDENNYIEEKENLLENICEKYYNDKEAMFFYFSNKEKISRNYKMLENDLKRYMVTEKVNDNFYFLLSEVEYKLKKYKESETTLKFLSNKGKRTKRYEELLRRIKNNGL